MHCRKNERGTKYRGLTYSAKQTVREICWATYSASQTRLRIYLTVSITVVQSIETPQITEKQPKPPKTPQTSTKPKPLLYYLRYHIMLDFFRTLMAFSGGGWPWVWYWHCARIHTGIGLNDHQLFEKLILVRGIAQA